MNEKTTKVSGSYRALTHVEPEGEAASRSLRICLDESLVVLIARIKDRRPVARVAADATAADVARAIVVEGDHARPAARITARLPG